MKFNKISYSIPWNLFLITAGSMIFGFGIKSIIIPNGLITGGFSGLGILLYYYTNLLTPGIWFLLFNIPVFILGWLFISRRFLLYSLYGAIILTLAIELIYWEIRIDDLILVTISGGVLIGAGAGIVFRSLGSSGGNDIISVILNQKLGVRIGTYIFVFNLSLFLLSFGTLEPELILYSIAMSYISSQVIEYFITLFNNRKMVLIISENYTDISAEIMQKLKRGVTFLQGRGGFTNKDKQIIMTVVNTFQIKRLEEIVFGFDKNAFIITENTLNVLGRGFSSRKVY